MHASGLPVSHSGRFPCFRRVPALDLTPLERPELVVVLSVAACDRSDVVRPRSLPMPLRLVAFREWPDIPVDRAMIVVGRHRACDVRLDSIRVSRRHCRITLVDGVLEVRDLGSTNGIRINGHRVEMGRLGPGDELSIAHIRYKLDGRRASFRRPPGPAGHTPIDNLLAAIVVRLLRSAEAEESPPDVVFRVKPRASGLREQEPLPPQDTCRHA
jgi:hypothetical protein